MPDNIEVFANGEAAFASAREVAWHRLGTVTEDAMTAEEAAKTALLSGWDVRLMPVQVSHEGLGNIRVPGRMATVRTHPITELPDPLGVVGDRYQVIQNEDAFAVLDGIVDEGGAHFETAGSLAGGRKVFMSMKMPNGIQIAGQDAHDVYLLAYNSHDGSSAFTLAVTPVRVVCQNTLTMGLRAAKQTWTLRHTSSVQGRIAEARESLKLTFNYMDEFSKELNAMLDEPMSHTEFKGVAEELVPVNVDSARGWRDRSRQNQSTLRQLFAKAETNEFGRGTKYAAYNAITEYADWYMPLRGQDPDGLRRAERSMTATSVQAFKNKGLALVRSA